MVTGPILQSMPLEFTAEQIAAGGATLVLVFMVTLFLRGEIVTQRMHREIVAGYERALEEKDQHIERVAEDRDLWRDIASNALDISEAVIAHK